MMENKIDFSLKKFSRVNKYLYICRANKLKNALIMKNSKNFKSFNEVTRVGDTFLFEYENSSIYMDVQAEVIDFVEEADYFTPKYVERHVENVEILDVKFSTEDTESELRLTSEQEQIFLDVIYEMIENDNIILTFNRK